MSGYLLDTHVWFWFLTASPRLPNEIRQTIDAYFDECRISVISVWELGMLAEKGRIDLKPSTREWIDVAQEQLPLKEAPLTREVALESLELALPHRDPADRFLAATALVFELTLLTVDRRLLEAKGVPTI